jgi:penicillin-binding protein 1A
MIFMMNKVVEEGTARRAMLDGVKAAGKTGTTNAYRDAWFVGYTGNFVAGIWFGNDDYSPLNRMTGGSLPAMTWHEIMQYAHQGIELKNLPGLPPNPAPTAPVAQNAAKGDAPRPAMLTFRGARVLVALEHMMEDASRALPAAPAGASAANDVRPAADRRNGPFAQAGGQQGATRGD